MPEIKTIQVKQIGGDEDWWTYGGTFLRVTESNESICREVWHCIGLEDEYADHTDDPKFCEDDPNLEVTVYRATLEPMDSKTVFIRNNISWVNWSGVESSMDVVINDLTHDYEVLIAVAGYEGWHNFDAEPWKYKQSELQKILELDKAELY